MRKFNLPKEAAIAALAILFLTFLLSFFSFKFEFTKIAKQGLLGFDIYDLHYSEGSASAPGVNQHIVIVQVGDNRKEIAEQLSTLSTANPKVIGVDVFFEEKKEQTSEDLIGDIELSNVLNEHKNIVLAYHFLSDSSQLKTKSNVFAQSYENLSGYANFIGNDSMVVVRTFFPFYEHDHKHHEAFATAIVRIDSQAAYNKLADRNNDEEIINYSGNLENFVSITKSELKEFDSLGQLGSLIKGKIVLLGYFTKDGLPVLSDLHFTPLNARLVGKSYPDMYGVVIHANIIAMILSGKYATFWPDLISYLVAFIVGFFLTLFMLKQYNRGRHPNHVLLLLLQLVVIIVLLYIFLVLFEWTLIKINLLPIIVGVVLSIEGFGVYQWLAGLLNKRFNYATIFIKKSHK